ncbi:MAG: hypothetical protein QM479_03105, partial [Pseudomonadota bacterium]
LSGWRQLTCPVFSLIFHSLFFTITFSFNLINRSINESINLNLRINIMSNKIFQDDKLEYNSCPLCLFKSSQLAKELPAILVGCDDYYEVSAKKLLKKLRKRSNQPSELPNSPDELIVQLGNINDVLITILGIYCLAIEKKNKKKMICFSPWDEI